MGSNINAFFIPVCLLIIFSTFQNMYAQEGYFQQKVNYDINVRLDDETHYLYGDIKMDYINQSPDTLHFIYFHLWPNAYRNKNTAFAKQNLRVGKLDFHFSKPSEIGGIKDLAFTSEAQVLKDTLDPENIDITKVWLHRPLAPGQKIRIETPFTVKIPGSFSRLGHVNQSYSITQWYPKPAVYDRNGWHPMPYLDMGEFYSEFGDFHVKITVPENYVVAASGTLMTKSEQEFLKTRLAENQNAENRYASTPPSSKTMKTLEFKASKVHDFAWFADKDFVVEQSSVDLSSGETILTSTYYRPENAFVWTGSIEYVNRSVKFYSEQVGNYPYPQASAVDGALVAGGGMEYPMITVIGKTGSKKSLDNVITHEVGHNWFYGILATNERVRPWMDEGLNTYYENKYMQTYYGPDVELPKMLFRDHPPAMAQVVSLVYADSRKIKPICAHSDAGGSIDYYLSVYARPAMAMAYLESYLGEKLFQSAMQTYYESWKFKHPGPADLKQSFEATTGKNLSWFFDDIICSTKQPQVRIAGLDRSTQNTAVKLKNTGAFPMPVSLEVTEKDSTSGETIWVEPFDNLTTVNIASQGWKKIRLDANQEYWFLSRRKHTVLPGGKIPVPWYLDFIPKVNQKTGIPIHILPLLGANASDGFMLGLALHNYAIPIGNFEWHLAPMYAFGSQRIVGLADAGYYFYPKGGFIENIRLGLAGRSFQYRHLEAFDLDLRYIKLQPSLEFELKANAHQNWRQQVRLRSIHLWEEQPTFNMNQQQEGTSLQASWIKEIQYKIERNTKLNPLMLRVALEQQNYSLGDRDENYLKAWLEFKNKMAFQKNRYFSMRVFAGTFLYNSRSELNLLTDGSGRGHFSLFGIGALDYKYDEFFVGRRENTGLGSQQIQINDGGFKNAITSQFSDGISSRFILALNLSSDLPQLPSWLPVRPYADFGLSGGFNDQPSQGPFDDRFYWAGGIQVVLLRGLMSVNFPIVQSSQITRFYQERGNYFKRISFSWNLGLKRPGEILRTTNFDNLIQ